MNPDTAIITALKYVRKGDLIAHQRPHPHLAPGGNNQWPSDGIAGPSSWAGPMGLTVPVHFDSTCGHILFRLNNRVLAKMENACCQDGIRSTRHHTGR